MSGNIAVPDSDNGTLLYKTLKECETARWIKLTPFGAGFNKAEITDSGRLVIRERRNRQAVSPGVDRRRSSSN